MNTSWIDLNWWLKVIKRGLLAVGLLLSILATGEFIRIYQFLTSLSIWSARAFLLISLLMAGWMLVTAARLLFSKPGRLPDLPNINNLEKSNQEDLIQYRDALLPHLDRMLSSEYLEETEKHGLLMASKTLTPATQNTDCEDLAFALNTLEKELVIPLQDHLDKAAEKEIRAATSQVIGAVTLSPWHSADLLVVIGRSLKMVLKISNIYGSRPTLGEQLLILKDVASAVAAVGLAGAGQKMIEGLTASVPLVGKVIDDVIQGAGAGFYVNLAGWAAKERCRTLNRWEPERARKKLRNQLGRFTSDLRRCLIVDLAPSIWERITKRFRSSQPEVAIGRDLRSIFDSAMAGLGVNPLQQDQEAKENINIENVPISEAPPIHKIAPKKPFSLPAMFRRKSKGGNN
jgi:uncharacterized protein (DUF697 family)